MTKDELDFLLAITNYAHGHWKDPEWGKRLTDQLMLLKGVQILASEIANPEIRATIVKAAENGLGDVALTAVWSSVPHPHSASRERNAAMLEPAATATLAQVTTPPSAERQCQIQRLPDHHFR
jgi:hypothetical protein